jgi:hypothetical protein
MNTEPVWFTTARQALTLVVATLTFAALSLVVAPQHSSAAEVRSGWKWNQVDVLLTSQETSDATTPQGTYNLCQGPVKAALRTGRFGGFAAIVTGGYCASAVTICGVRAQAKGKKAGMTFSLGTRFIDFWCWDY